MFIKEKQIVLVRHKNLAGNCGRFLLNLIKNVSTSFDVLNMLVRHKNLAGNCCRFLLNMLKNVSTSLDVLNMLKL
jgi:hypothetical protein